jgi:hypothetical protein
MSALRLRSGPSSYVSGMPGAALWICWGWRRPITDWLLCRGVFSQVLICMFFHLLIPAGLALLSVIGALAVT